MQVAAVFQPLCCAVGLDVAAVSGKGPLSCEAAALVQTQGQAAGSRVDVLVATPGRCGGLLHAAATAVCSILFYLPVVEIRRLVAHMRSTPGFTLQHLQFLVVDEADRLLRQAYQASCFGWRLGRCDAKTLCLPSAGLAAFGSGSNSASLCRGGCVGLAVDAAPAHASAAGNQ